MILKRLGGISLCLISIVLMVFIAHGNAILLINIPGLILVVFGGAGLSIASKDFFKLSGSQKAYVFGKYAFWMGYLGILIGLFNMILMLDDPKSIGPAIGVLIVPLMYGGLFYIIGHSLAGGGSNEKGYVNMVALHVLASMVLIVAMVFTLLWWPR